MSLALAAQHLASRGRGPDTMLVHMAPSEVHSLQAVAKAHGGSLTINPETGLPEAGFLSSILPMIAGVGLTALSGGTLSPLMAGLLTGGVTGVATGNLGKGLMAGLGAYGGAGLGSALAGAGAQDAILQANPGMAASEIARASVEPGFVQPSMTDKMLAGVKGLGSETGRDAFMQSVGGAKGLFKSGAAALSPLMMAQAAQQARPPSMGGPNPYQYDYYPGATGARPSADSSESSYFNPRFVSRMADGGDTGMTGQSDEYYRYLMGLAPAPRPYTPTAPSAAPAVSAAASPAQVSLTPYQQAVAKMTPAELAAHNDYLANSTIEKISGPAGLDPTTANQQAQQNMIDPVTGQPNAIVSGLVPLANMLNIVNPQQGFLQAGIPGAILGNAAQAAQNANISSISESSGNQVGPELGGMSVQEGMLSGLDALPDSGVGAGSNDPGVGGTVGDDVGIKRGGLASLAAFAQGGYNLGDYSDGGRLLKGPGDGVSDSIPASIADKRPARLADGEFVVPARIVSELGNGSTDAGARRLYAMMDRIQQNRGKTTGKGKVAVNSRSEKYLPA